MEDRLGHEAALTGDPVQSREVVADLRGRVALLTGGRVKIGYQAGLKLLRAGAHLISENSFPVPMPGRGSKNKERDVTPDQIKLVQDSFAKVAPISDQAAIIFYNRLFEVAPSVKAMFPEDMTEAYLGWMREVTFTVCPK